MEITLLGESLQEPVRDVLNRIESTWSAYVEEVDHWSICDCQKRDFSDVVMVISESESGIRILRWWRGD
jgi:hypothetical protein